jgi:hypothetical protein
MANLKDGSRVLGDLTVDDIITSDIVNSNSLFINNTSGNLSLEISNAGLIKLAEFVGNILIGSGIDNNVDKLQVNGTMTHKGLSLSSGTNIDQVVTITKTLVLVNDWIDTGISATDLVKGTYIIQLYANDFNVGGSNINEYYSGIMSWYDSVPNTSAVLPTDEIPLHRSGASDGDTGLYLRTYRTNSDKVKLQIFSIFNNVASSNYIFSFRRII